MSFFTWRWLLPQELQRSCSLPSVARAMFWFYLCFSDFSTAGCSAVRDDLVDDPVLVGLFARHVVVALHVLRDLFGRLIRVFGDDLLQAPLETDGLARLDLDVGALPLVPAGARVDEDLRPRQRGALSLRAGREQERAHRHRDADARRRDVRLDEL